MVLSRRNAWQVRQGIRDTWASQGNRNVFFILGQGCPTPPQYRGSDEGGNSYCKVHPRPIDQNYFNATMQQIQEEQRITERLLKEQEQYGDLLVMPHTIDMYRTLPAKLKFAYTFVHFHLPHTVQWVLKVDDDFFVRISEFEAHLQTIRTEHHKGDKLLPAILVGGDIRLKHAAHTGGKWKELPQFPRGALYPPFPLGSYGHAVTRPIVSYVAQYQDALFDYQGEDVSIGIWLESQTYPHAPNTTFVKSPHMANHGDCLRPKFYVVGHDISHFKMRVCQRAFDNTTTADNTASSNASSSLAALRVRLKGKG